MSTKVPGPRRSTHTAMPVAYGAIGASAAPDLLRFPPADSTPYEEAVQLGSGSERFLTAASLLMTWGAQRVAGVEVVDIEAGEPGKYTGLIFADDGTPEVGAATEELFTPEGEPYLQPGTTATFVVSKRVSRRIMVVSTVVESHRLGFSWGDCEEVAGCGEQQLVVEHRADGTVWAVVRGFAYLKPTGVLAGLKQRSTQREVIGLAQSFLAALQPGAAIRTGLAKTENDDDEGAKAHDGGGGNTEVGSTEVGSTEVGSTEVGSTDATSEH